MASRGNSSNGLTTKTTKTFAFSWGGTDWYTHSVEYGVPENEPPAHSTGVVFDVELFAPSRFSLELPWINQLSSGTRWVEVIAESGFIFKVCMKLNQDCYEFRRGFSLLATSECLQDQQIARFELINPDTFKMWNDDYLRTNEPIGFSTGKDSSDLLSWTKNDFIVARGTNLSHTFLSCMHQCWAASPVHSKMFVCTILKSHTPPGVMSFPREYSMCLPKKKMNVALRFIGSPVIIPSSVTKYDRRTAKVSRGWALFAREHNIVVGQVMVFRIHRGTKGWELLACR